MPQVSCWWGYTALHLFLCLVLQQSMLFYADGSLFSVLQVQGWQDSALLALFPPPPLVFTSIHLSSFYQTEVKLSTVALENSFNCHLESHSCCRCCDHSHCHLSVTHYCLKSPDSPCPEAHSVQAAVLKGEFTSFSYCIISMTLFAVKTAM